MENKMLQPWYIKEMSPKNTLKTFSRVILNLNCMLYYTSFKMHVTFREKASFVCGITFLVEIKSQYLLCNQFEIDRLFSISQ